jgi:uncharacterized protein (TIGR02118 family)
MDQDTICCIAVLAAINGADPEAMQAEWLTYDPVADLARGARYRRSIAMPSEERGFRPKQIYGIAHAWLDGVEAASKFCRQVKGGMLPDTQVTAIAFRELVVIDGPERHGGADGVVGYYYSTRKPGMSVEAFQAHWRDVHGPLVVPSPGISRYVQYFPCPETYGGDLEPKYDSLAVLTFPDKAAQAEFAASEHNAVHQRNDLPNLWDMTGGALRFYVEDRFDRAAAG